MPHETSLLSELRRRIKDTTRSVRALTIGISDPTVTSAIAEVTGGRLMITVASGVASSLDLRLSDARYDTIGKVYQAISRSSGYACQLDQDASNDHASADVEPFGPLEIATAGVNLNHHLFSDSELLDILDRAIQRHNPTSTIATLPPQEYVFVLPLAHADVCRIQAYDSSKRRGLTTSVSDLLTIANSFEEQHTLDVQRHARSIQSPREANSNTMDEGDFVLGTFSRRSLRTGFKTPLSSTTAPNPPVLLTPDEHDVEDDNARIVWERSKDYDFYSYELWMDSRPDVVREREGGLVYAGTPVSIRSDDTLRDGALRSTTSVMVFRSFGANSNSNRSTFSTFVEEFGQLMKSFAVSRLESETRYYFRLYVIGINYIASSSNVVEVLTKALRARFMSQNVDPSNPAAPTGSYADKASGPPGTVVTITLNPTKGAFTAQHIFKVGEKEVIPTILTPYSLSVTIPAFQVYGPKQFVIVSPNQLVDVRNNAFTVTTS